MNKNDAIKFLKKNQPLPNDDVLTENDAIKLDEIRKFFLKNLSSECIPLLLNVTGYLDGHGVYQLLEEVYKKHNHNEVILNLKDSLHSPKASIRFWSIYAAIAIDAVELKTFIENLLSDQDENVREAAELGIDLLDFNIPN